jgi:hypothetical protein
MNFNFNFKDMPPAAGRQSAASQTRVIGITRGNPGLSGSPVRPDWSNGDISSPTKVESVQRH